MEKNVGSVDLDELLKARQELNSERGIKTIIQIAKRKKLSREKASLSWMKKLPKW